MEDGNLLIATVDFQENGDQTFCRTTITADSEREIRQLLKMIKPAKRGITLDVSSVYMCKEDDFVEMYEKHGSDFGTPFDLYATFIAMKKKGMLEPLDWY